MAPGCLAFAVFLILLILFPLILAEAVLTALGRLGLGLEASVLLALGIFLGGMVNIPVRRIPREEVVAVPRLRLFGLDALLPRVVRRRSYTVIAVNLGGCVVPTLIAGYQVYRLWTLGGEALGAAAGAIAINTVVCYALARPAPAWGSRCRRSCRRWSRRPRRCCSRRISRR